MSLAVLRSVERDAARALYDARHSRTGLLFVALVFTVLGGFLHVPVSFAFAGIGMLLSFVWQVFMIPQYARELAKAERQLDEALEE